MPAVSVPTVEAQLPGLNKEDESFYLAPELAACIDLANLTDEKLISLGSTFIYITSTAISRRISLIVDGASVKLK